jgi:hypothetical protein
MAQRKIVAVEYGGKQYLSTRAEVERLAADPHVDAAQILVTYDTGLQVRPFRFISDEVSVGEDGVARVF